MLVTRRPSVLLLVSLLVALVLPVGTADARVAPRPDPSTRSYTTSEARGLLAEAQRKLRPDTRSRGGRGIGKGPQTELTSTLLALFRARSALSGTERRQADAILARPTNGAGDDAVKYGNIPFRTRCFSGTLFCVHWVTTGRNAISTTDSDRDGIPNYVEYVITTMKYVYAAEVTRMGYRKPLYDTATAGRYRGNPNGKYDIYLAELGSAGLYGYCAPEGSTRPHQSPGYCVLDNNYAPSQYGDRNFLNPLRVTAAHEFFHAIQFGYDVDEDLWFMEGTATWIEDEVFDAVDDNYQYLSDSPIRFPRSAVDYSAYLHKYGAWIFFRYATEFLDDPAVVRSMWEAADASAGDQYSLQAIVSTVSLAHDWKTFFVRFGLWNLLGTGTYAERAGYPAPVYRLSTSLTSSRRSTGLVNTNLVHASTSSIRVGPDASLPTTSRLRIRVNGPDLDRGPAALVQVRLRNGSVQETELSLNAAGYGETTVGFDRTTVSSVVVVVANTSTAMRDCDTTFAGDGGPLYSCYGRGVTDPTGSNPNTYAVIADVA